MLFRINKKKVHCNSLHYSGIKRKMTYEVVLIVSTKQPFFRLLYSKNIDWNEKPTETTNSYTLFIGMDGYMSCQCTTNTLTSRPISEPV